MHELQDPMPPPTAPKSQRTRPPFHHAQLSAFESQRLIHWMQPLTQPPCNRTTAVDKAIADGGQVSRHGPSCRRSGNKPFVTRFPEEFRCTKQSQVDDVSCIMRWCGKHLLAELLLVYLSTRYSVGDSWVAGRLINFARIMRVEFALIACASGPAKDVI